AATMRLPVTTTDAFVTTAPVLTSSILDARRTVVFGAGCAPSCAAASARLANNRRAILVMKKRSRSELSDERAPLVDQRAVLRIVVSRREEPRRVVGQRRRGDVSRKQISGSVRRHHADT